MHKTKEKTAPISASLQHATGTLPYRMTNDYLFRAVFQSSPKALEGLCRAVLHLSPEDTLSVTIQNPIKLGETLDDKEFILDLNVLINEIALMNLEMQVLNEGNWPERSLSYLCRSFDNLTKGSDFIDVLPVIHVGFLDFTLFKKHPEFFATYQMMNVKNHHIYSDKLRLSVVDLSQIALATDEDKLYGIDYWAALFKATTWEEIKMLASKSEYLQEASNTVYKMTSDREIRERCQAREDYLFWERIKNNKHAKELAERDAALREKETELLHKDAVIQSQEEELFHTTSALREKEEELAHLRAELEALKSGTHKAI